ncbi:disease resistance protein SUMM2-like [Vitis riparia]|uniref:disease resistance protein SUMM2-like n=1 Tax=Vitis riparia TaxID=96939 RepID=UPI00155AA79F|nr:disease resistance protein SUMM2-like [Vitis riparia]
MGNICSISLSADRIVSSFWDGTTEHANYLRKLPENLVELGTAWERLKELRNDVKRKVDIAEREQMQPLDQVQGWLSRVETLETQVTQLLGDGTDEPSSRTSGNYRPIWLGGVGKTTLLTQINNAFTKRTHDFDFVIWATVSRNVNLENIQDDIWKKIGFCDDKWKSKSRDEKATSIWRVLSEKRFVLLLDDLWERLTLSDVGVPFQSKKNKIVFTTRSEEVCAQMEADKKIKVECLTWTESWELFRMKLGEDTLDFHPEIPELAQAVAQECCGLPLVLTTMGRAMACEKTPQEWKYAIKVVRSSASKFPGFLDEFDDMEGAQNQGYNIIGTLIHACLLEETNNDYRVKLHDVIRDMALWIACGTGKEQHEFLVQAVYGLTEAPEVARWMEPKRISLIGNQIEKLTGSPNCPNLLTLFLRDNNLMMISDSFFRFVPNLRVLDLTRNSITELPRGISKLLSSIPEQLISSLLMLQVIDMFDCGICDGDEALVEELESLKYLHDLGVTITSLCFQKAFKP